MTKSLTPLVIYTLIVTQSFIYATQPLQPLLAQEFGVSMVHASYFTAVVLFCMAAAPIIYGYIFRGHKRKKNACGFFGCGVFCQHSASP